MYEKLEQLRELKEQYTKKLRAEGKAVIQSVLKIFFEANPKILALKWRQYTPYFNDGDACYFHVRSIDCQLAEEACQEFKYTDGDGWSSDGYYAFDSKSPMYAVMFELHTQFQQSEDLLEMAFGDHVRVVATRDGNIDVSRYDHE